MFRFVLGVIVGAVAASYLQRTQVQSVLDREFAGVQDRANAVLVESRRVLEEVRGEFGAALESGLRSVEIQAERLRRAADGQE